MGRLLSSLRFDLLLVILLAMLPVLALTLFTNWEHRRTLAAGVQADALRVARLAASEQVRTLESAHQVLLALAELPEVRDGTPGCGASLARLLAQYRVYQNLGVASLRGDVFCSGVPLAGPVNVADRPYFQRALAEQSFAVGEYQVGRITDRASLNGAYPLIAPSGQTQAIMFVAIDLQWLNQLAAEARLPPGSTVTVIDRSGTILARYPDPDQWLGRSTADASLVQIVLAQHEGVAETPGLDGEQRLFAFAPLGSGAGGDYAYTIIGIPAPVAFADADQMLARNLAGLALVTLLALVGAWFMGQRYILRSVDTLVDAAQRLAAGNLSTRTGLRAGQGELSQVARAFDEMAATLEQREGERQRAAAELTAAKETAEAASRAKSAFLLTMSHELRTPLNAIISYSEILQENAEQAGDAERISDLQEINTAGRHLLSVIGNVLEIARLQAGDAELHLATFDLAPLVTAGVADARLLATKNGNELRVHAASSLGTMHSDREKVQAILAAVLDNACKFTSDGLIELYVERRTDAARPMVVWRVCDSGIGITSSHLDRLFEPFGQLDDSTTRRYGGSGLGLAIARRLCWLLGGDITVTSALGVGSTFTITLPADLATERVQQSPTGALASAFP